MFCIKCGKALPDEAIFCMYCGCRLPVIEEFEKNIEELAEPVETMPEDCVEEIRAEEGCAEEVCSPQACEADNCEDTAKADAGKELTGALKKKLYDENALLARRYTWGLDVEKDSDKAKELCEKLLEMEPENGLGYCRLALYYDSVGDYEKSIEYHKKGYELGCKDSLAHLAYFYRFGKGVEQDENKAREMYFKAAVEGSAYGANLVGVMYSNGILGVEADPDSEFEWFSIAADRGDETGMMELGRCYQFGYGCEVDIMTAVSLYKMAHERFNDTASWRLSTVFLDKESGLYDIEEGMKYRKIAMQRGESRAFADMGYDYAYGRNGLSVDHRQAEEYFIKSAEMGFDVAMSELAIRYSSDDNYPYDYAAAEKWAIKAMEKGSLNGIRCLYGVYEDEKSACYDPVKSFELKRMAANNGDMEASYNMAIDLLYGNGTEADANHAVRLLKESAECGDSDSMYVLGLVYSGALGQGAVKANSVLAAGWFKKAVGAGNTNAMKPLAKMYAQGEGIGQSYAEAFELFKKCAQAGDSEAMYFTGAYYLTGNGVRQNRAEAIVWLKKARDNGEKRADEMLASTAFDMVRSSNKEDVELGISYLQEAAQLGNAEALDCLYDIYARGVISNVIPQNGIRAIKILEECAKRRNIHAQYKLAIIYDCLDVNFKDICDKSKAVYWYERAANNGTSGESLAAMVNLALSYAEGDGVPVNHGKEVELLMKAADLGSAQAQYLMGMRYYSGKVIRQNTEKAKKYLQQAMDGNNPYFSANASIYNGLILNDEGRKDAAVYFIEKGLNSGVLTDEDIRRTRNALEEIKSEREYANKQKRFIGKKKI